MNAHSWLGIGFGFRLCLFLWLCALSNAAFCLRKTNAICCLALNSLRIRHVCSCVLYTTRHATSLSLSLLLLSRLHYICLFCTELLLLWRRARQMKADNCCELTNCVFSSFLVSPSTWTWAACATHTRADTHTVCGNTYCALLLLSIFSSFAFNIEFWLDKPLQSHWLTFCTHCRHSLVLVSCFSGFVLCVSVLLICT